MSPSQAGERAGVDGIQRRLLEAEIVPALERVDHERPRGCPRDDEPVRHVSAAGGDVPGKQVAVARDDHPPFAIELLEDPRRSFVRVVCACPRERHLGSQRRWKVDEPEQPLAGLDELQGEPAVHQALPRHVLECSPRRESGAVTGVCLSVSE